MDASFAVAPCNRQEGVRFVCGDATRLEFEDGAFDAVTMFDVIERYKDRVILDHILPRDRWRPGVGAPSA